MVTTTDVNDSIKAKPTTFGSGGKPTPNFVEKDRTPRITIPEVPLESNEQKAERQKDKLPKPKGWRILVIPFSQPTQSAGGIHFTAKTKQEEEIATVIGQVVSLGPLAYSDEYKFMGIPWCKEGDFVIFARYSGSRVRLFGSEADGSDDLSCRLLNDDEILAVVDNPTDYVGLS